MRPNKLSNNLTSDDVLTEEQTLVVDDVDSSTDKAYHIMVYNDDFNTFDHVIGCFVEILGHSDVQAEQCAILIHEKGSCSVKVGSQKFLFPKKDALCDKLIDARIEKI